ncbi:MAG: pyruvate kinase [Bacteroidales bacterium]|nr:pyruvate kinase [Bacteroidales bacterium]
MKKTKIIATLSDQKSDEPFLKELFDNGVNVVRINTAHQDIEGAERLIKRIRSVNDKIAILIDTKGPEVRTAAKGEVLLVKDEMIKVLGNSQMEISEMGIPVSYSELYKYVKVDDLILIDDGEIELKVIKIENAEILCRVIIGGLVKSRKGVNVPNVELPLPVLSEKDKEFIQFAMDQKIAFIAHSFVQRASDVLQIKEILNAHKSKVKVISKIENRAGVDNVDLIIAVSDGIMVARGDLGIEIPGEQIPVIQQNIVNKCIRAKIPVIIATQMLHSMINSHRPTRAEISDVATAVFERTDALMLSGETAYGKYPIEAVKVMTKVALEVEAELDHLPFEQEKGVDTFTSTLCKAAILTTSNHSIQNIIADTTSGKTCRYISALRGRNHIYAMCYDQTVMRQLSLSYGVIAHKIESTSSHDRFLRSAISMIIAQKEIDPTENVLIIGGSFGRAHGVSFIEIASPELILSEQCS